jgi:hypothetical protein
LNDLGHKEESKDKINCFLHCFLQLQNYLEVASKLIMVLDTCMKENKVEETISYELLERDVFQVNKQKHTSQEFKMMKELCGYEMEGVLLDMGYNVNILSNKYWEVMGKPKFLLSPIQVHLANQ